MNAKADMTSNLQMYKIMLPDLYKSFHHTVCQLAKAELMQKMLRKPKILNKEPN